MIVLLGLLMAKDIQYPAEAAEFQEKKSGVSREEDSVAKPWDPFQTSLYFVRSRLPAV
jgi:hypothetical protein